MNRVSELVVVLDSGDRLSLLVDQRARTGSLLRCRRVVAVLDRAQIDRSPRVRAAVAAVGGWS